METSESYLGTVVVQNVMVCHKLYLNLTLTYATSLR